MLGNLVTTVCADCDGSDGFMLARLVEPSSQISPIYVSHEGFEVRRERKRIDMSPNEMSNYLTTAEKVNPSELAKRRLA